MLGVLEELEMEDMQEDDLDFGLDLDSASISGMSKAQSQKKNTGTTKSIDRAFEVRKRNVIRQALLANISCSIIHEA